MASPKGLYAFFLIFKALRLLSPIYGHIWFAWFHCRVFLAASLMCEVNVIPRKINVKQNLSDTET